jgi:hypothetical protein
VAESHPFRRRDVVTELVPDGWRAAGEQVDALDETTVGTWLVRTAGSTHLWEIEDDGEIWWTRLPGPGGGSLLYDGARHHVTRVDAWPAVGGIALLWFDDPANPVMVEQWRRSSLIRTIERLEPASGPRPSE